MDVLCISKAWMWLKGKEFTATMPDSAGDVDLREAQWYAYNWKDKKYEKLAASDDGYQIKEEFIDDGNNVKLIAASEKKASGSSGGCNAGAFAPISLLFISLGLLVVRKR